MTVTPADEQRAKRAARKAAGLCARCGKVPPEQDRTACRPCLDYVGMSVRDRVERKRERERLAAAAQSTEGETFVRACVEHQLPLVGLDCPKGQHAAFDDGRDEDLAWLVVHVRTGRVAATVHGERVTWEPWFEAEFEEVTRKLSGRREDGLTGNKGEHYDRAMDGALTTAARRKLNLERNRERRARPVVPTSPKEWRRRKTRAA